MATLNVNGQAQTFEGDPSMPLLWYLRDELGLYGNEIQLRSGRLRRLHHPPRRRGRQSPASRRSATPNGKSITTIEGLDPQGNYPLQKAWRALNVPQCGFCQAGQIMQAAALLKQTPHPTDADIDGTMYGNICRCGTYQRIRAAIKQAAGA